MRKLSLNFLLTATILSVGVLFYASTASAQLFTTIDVTGNPVVYKNMYVGQTQQLKATNHASGVDITSSVNWSTQNQSVVQVSSTGLVYAIGAGSGTITASCMLCYDTETTFNVTEAPVEVTPSPTPTAINLLTCTTGQDCRGCKCPDNKTCSPTTNKCIISGNIDTNTNKNTNTNTNKTSSRNKDSTGNKSATLTNPLDKIETFPQLLTKIASEVGKLIAILGTIMLIVAGILYLTSAGNPERVGTAKKALIYAIAGIVIGLAASAIVSIIKDVVGVK